MRKCRIGTAKFFTLLLLLYRTSVKKEGGSYQEYTGKVRQLDPVERKLVFLAANERSAGKNISIDDILEIHGDLVDDI